MQGRLLRNADIVDVAPWRPERSCAFDLTLKRSAGADRNIVPVSFLIYSTPQGTGPTVIAAVGLKCWKLHPWPTTVSVRLISCVFFGFFLNLAYLLM
jgi:hypothetical protein